MIIANDIRKTYRSGSVETPVLFGIDLSVHEGEFVAIMGKSGAGKSTLMYQIGLLDRPTSGSVTIDGVDILALSDNERTEFRLHNLGYIFQDYALVPELSALENVAVPLMMLDIETSEAKNMATQALKRVDLGHRLGNRSSQLSGGEQQRVSIARAIVQEPLILFADEPTANLDTASSETVLGIMKELNHKGQTIVMVTHEHEYASYADRIIHLEDGKIVSEEKPKH